jgi:hypothetical protein
LAGRACGWVYSSCDRAAGFGNGLPVSYISFGSLLKNRCNWQKNLSTAWRAGKNKMLEIEGRKKIQGGIFNQPISEIL